MNPVLRVRQEVPRLGFDRALRTRRARPSRKTPIDAIPGLFPVRQSFLGQPPLGGGLCRPVKESPGLANTLSPLGHWRLACLRSFRHPSAYVRPSHADAQSASLRGNGPSRYLGPFPPRPVTWGRPPAEGRAPHARSDGIDLTRACPHWVSGRSCGPFLDSEMPHRAYGCKPRARRVRLL